MKQFERTAAFWEEIPEALYLISRAMSLQSTVGFQKNRIKTFTCLSNPFWPIGTFLKKRRFESFVKNDKHGIESVHFIDFVRKANIMKTDRSKFKIKKKKTLEKQSSGFRGLKKSKKTALNVLWGIKKKCSYSNCKGEFSKRKWVRNTFFNDVYCPTCMDKNLKKKTKKWKKKVGRMYKKRTKNNPEEEEEQHDDDDDDDGLVDNNVNDVDPYKCNIEGGEDVYEFVLDGHLKTAYVIINNEDKIDDKKTIEKKEAKVEELKVEMDAILTKVAYIDDGNEIDLSIC